MNYKRPVNLDLGSLKYPPMAIASILHRVSGLILFLLLPIMLYLLHYSLASAEAFECMHNLLISNGLCKLIFWAFSTAWTYHVLAGTRHLLMDIGVGETVSAGKLSAYFVIGLAILSATVLGVCIWSM